MIFIHRKYGDKCICRLSLLALRPHEWRYGCKWCRVKAFSRSLFHLQLHFLTRKNLKIVIHVCRSANKKNFHLLCPFYILSLLPPNQNGYTVFTVLPRGIFPTWKGNLTKLQKISLGMAARQRERNSKRVVNQREILCLSVHRSENGKWCSHYCM